jgi:signal transduction histidine kinase
MDLYEHAQSDLEHEQIITMFRTSVERLNETVEDLSEIIKINQNINIKLVEIEFDEMLKLVEESIALRINETGAIIHRDFRACKRLVYNKAYLESILLNLITNAIKYKHPNRCPKIEILSWRSGSDVMISCRDNGIGIDLEKHGSKIFGLHKTFHGNQDARGVGLFITKNQVEAFFGGTRQDMTGQVGARLTDRLSTEAQYTRNEVDLVNGSFDVDLASVRVDFALSPTMTLRSVTQYNSQSEQFGTSARFRWTYSPGSDVYLTYDEVHRDPTDPTGLLEYRDRRLILKATYLLSR